MSTFIENFNSLIEKYGTDKCLHFLVGALVSNFIFLTFFVFCGVNCISYISAFLMSAVSTFVISMTKEIIDKKADIDDINAGMYGCGASVLSVLVVFSIYLLVQ